jgi:hypothetical protein
LLNRLCIPQVQPHLSCQTMADSCLGKGRLMAAYTNHPPFHLVSANAASRPMLVVYQHHAFMQFLQIPAEPSQHEGSCGHAAAPIAGGRRNATRNLLVLLVKIQQWASGLACSIGRIRPAKARSCTHQVSSRAHASVYETCAHETAQARPAQRTQQERSSAMC